jgi:hypothetical protein
MSFNFQIGYPNGPTAVSPPAKDIQIKAVKLTSADFTTGGTASVKAVLPQDASIIRLSYWTKTTFSGNGVSALSLSIGVTGTRHTYCSYGRGSRWGSSCFCNLFQRSCWHLSYSSRSGARNWYYRCINCSSVLTERSYVHWTPLFRIAPVLVRIGSCYPGAVRGWGAGRLV